MKPQAMRFLLIGAGLAFVAYNSIYPSRPHSDKYSTNNHHTITDSPKANLTGAFDFYVLALSWSSGFCETSQNARNKSQCDLGSNIGFTVHGLWPQFERGYPSDCDSTTRSPSQIAMQKAQGLFPDESLARYEWRKHGTCSGLSPSEYFDNVRVARNKITIPENFTSPKSVQTLPVNDITRAFVASNPELRADMMMVACKQGVLEEVRICLDKDLRHYRSCPEVARSGCRTTELKVPPVR